jgi:hypothetical protein
MGEQQPTPGPWHSDYVEVIGKSRQYEISSKSRFIAGCGGGTPEDEANARLITAAPDLLKLLDDAAEFYNEGRVWTPEFAAKVEAAIAKAHGASNA